jgi:hypothetical protein
MYPIPALVDFLVNKDIKFSKDDIRGDTKVLARAKIKIPDGNHIDIQDEWKKGTITWNGEIARDGMACIAAEVIDISYLNMKSRFGGEDHLHWEWKPLREGSLNYAAIDGYLSYNIYARVRLYTLRTAHLRDKVPAPLTDEESSGGNWKKTWSDDDDEPPVAWKNAHNVPLVSKWKDGRNRRSDNKSSYSN